jgi:hypothetical protein
MGILQELDHLIERFDDVFYPVEVGREQISCAEFDEKAKDASNACQKDHSQWTPRRHRTIGVDVEDIA